MSELLRLLRGAKVFDLAQPYFVGMPHYPTHPPFLFSLTRKHPAASGVGSASDAIAFSGHCGTHMDALCHFSRDGKVHDGTPLEGAQGWATGVGALSIDTVAPILRRGVLLDIAGTQGRDVLPDDFTITPEHLDAAAAEEKVAVEPGDVVLLRTGRGRYWDDPVRYFSGGNAPGPEEPAARRLSELKIFAAGSDTMSFEKVPSAMPVHAHLLVDRGIHLIECLNLEELASARLYTFLFLALPLKIRGGTGSPIRPVAVAC
jgi:kynurenine formamidase